MVKLLFVDDDPLAHKTLRLVLPEQYTLLSAYTGADGLSSAERESPDAILLDINLPDIDGVSVLRQVAARPLAPPIVMLTALADARLVKEAILAGACDYIVKPYAIAELLGALRTAVCGADARRAAMQAGSDPLLGGLLGESAAMRDVRQLILRYGPSDSPLLVCGESGTGKELVARAIHGASRRRNAPFVALNCGAIPESLLETELFGSERGAFTDAVSRAGCFEQANGGTLFLDEIGEMPAAAQVRLLRVLEQRELVRVGGSRPLPLDVRVVSATNRDLKAEVKRGVFRGDLFYRLSVLPIRVPPLRERREDIPLLAAHFLAAGGAQRVRFSASAIAKLIEHPWPGNVRELRNVIERALLADRGASIGEQNILFD